MDTLPKIPRVIAPTRSTAVQVLREAIAQRLLRPGTRLSERQLAQTLGISRPTLREALRELETEGLFDRDELGRLIVAPVDGAMARSLYEVREILEGTAAALFAQRATDEEIAALRQTLDDLASAVAKNDVREYLLLKDQFYSLLLAGSRNPILETLLRSLQWRFRFLRATSLQAPGRLEASLAEMREIVAAIECRNAQLAEQRSRQHIRNAAAAMSRMLDRTEVTEVNVSANGGHVAVLKEGGHARD